MRNSFIKFSLTLMIIISLCVSILAFINMKTKPIIVKQRAEARKRAVIQVLPKGSVDFVAKELDGKTFYVGYSDKNKTQISGYAALAKGKGYSSTIEIMVGVDLEYRVTGTKVISQQETPGLGTKINQKGKYQGKTDMIWIEQFIGKTSKEIALNKDAPNQKNAIEAVTGATISSRAATTAIKEQLKNLKTRTENME